MAKVLQAKSRPDSSPPGKERASASPGPTKSIRTRARRDWLVFLASKNRTNALFELEMLLEGMLSFGAPENRPHGPSVAPDSSVDVRNDLHALSLALRASVRASGTVLGMSSGSTESDAPDDASKNGTPENALRSLRAALTDHVELTDNLLRLGTVPDSLFRAAHRSLARDIEHSGFLYALGVLDVEDPVGDARIDESPEGLQVLPTEATRRSMASAFSALRRARACAALSEGYAQRASTSTGAHVLLAGLRQDLREITQYLTTRAGQDLADGFEEIVISMNAHEREMQRAELARVATGLKSLRTRIQGIAYVLRLEALRLFERDMPARDRSGATEPDVSVRTAAVAAELRSIIDDARDDLRSAVRLSPFFGDGGDHRTRRSDRLRRNVWMLTQALRAFLAKAEAFSAEGLDRWDSPASLHFAAEFLVHFTALGTSVIHELRYERTPQLTAALSALTGPDGMGALAVPAAIAEGTALFELLELALVSISDRNELHDMPFDKRAAAETLKLHLEVPL